MDSKHKQHSRQIPAHLLRKALDLLEFHAEVADPQQAFIDLLDNYRSSRELHVKTRLPMEDCARIIHLRDIATSFTSKTKN